MGRAVGGAAEKVRTLAAAQGVDDVDGHALAGFIEAEGSFSIVPNNGGRSWLCGMSLNQRADDADVLCDIVRVTGLGRLYPVPARRTSRCGRRRWTGGRSRCTGPAVRPTAS